MLSVGDFLVGSRQVEAERVVFGSIGPILFAIRSSVGRPRRHSHCRRVSPADLVNAAAFAKSPWPHGPADYKYVEWAPAAS